jgi:hypothetical protein
MEDPRKLEGEAYLARLRKRAHAREQVKETRKASQKINEEAAGAIAERFLDRLGSRRNFRVSIREKWIDDTKRHELIMGRLGEIYRKRLTAISKSIVETSSQKNKTW